MKVIKTIKSGSAGSKRFEEIWGSKLLYVRYREISGEYITTIEIIVDRRARPKQGATQYAQLSWLKKQPVALSIGFTEYALRNLLKRNGAEFSSSLKLWITTYNTAVKLALTDRIVEGAAERCTDVILLD